MVIKGEEFRLIEYRTPPGQSLIVRYCTCWTERVHLYSSQSKTHSLFKRSTASRSRTQFDPFSSAEIRNRSRSCSKRTWFGRNEGDRCHCSSRAQRGAWASRDP